MTDAKTSTCTAAGASPSRPRPSRILGEILIAANNRVYIVEGETPLNVPPAAQFQASIQILNNEGVRIRTGPKSRRRQNEVAAVGAVGE